ncbi:MAG: rod shape-determining protein MreC [Patescibacteria group bacterium]|jgi:rod shape-determining protein MreC
MRARTKASIAIAGSIIAVVLLRLVGALAPVEELFRRALLPVAQIFSTIGSGAGSLLRPNPEEEQLREHVVELEARVTSLAVDYVRLRALEEENHSLQALTGYLSTSGYDHVPARVIARSNDPRSATVLIDRGSKDGIETGMAVIVGEGVFVGKVTSLKERVSTITLVADERSRIAASLSGQHRLLGLVEGRGNHVARLTLVPQAEGLEPDDVIVTSGTEEKIPANLIVGLVNAIEGKPTDPFKSAALEPVVQADTLNLVSVLRPTVLRPESP